MKLVIVVLGLSAALSLLCAADKKVMAVKIVDRQNHDTVYTYFVPGYSTTNANGNANCFGTDASVNGDSEASRSAFRDEIDHDSEVKPISVPS